MPQMVACGGVTQTAGLGTGGRRHFCSSLVSESGACGGVQDSEGSVNKKKGEEGRMEW